MKQAHIIVEYVDEDEIPGGVPAAWDDAPSTNGDRSVHLFMRRDLPPQIEDYLRATAVRNCLPTLDLRSYTVVTEAIHVSAVA